MLARVTSTPLKGLASSSPRPYPSATPIPDKVPEENALVTEPDYKTRPHPTPTNSRGDEQSFSDSFPRGETESQPGKRLDVDHTGHFSTRTARVG